MSLTIKKGEIIFIDGHAKIDCTDLIVTEKFQIKLPAGVTLASDRGSKGSEGAVIRSNNLATSPLINALGPNIRITGLRISGPDPQPAFGRLEVRGQRSEVRGQRSEDGGQRTEVGEQRTEGGDHVRREV